MEKTLGELLKEGRTNSKLSLRSLAKLTGMNHTDIARIEKGLYTPKPEVLRNISRYIDTNYHDLMAASGNINYLTKDNEYVKELIDESKGDINVLWLNAFSGVTAFEGVLVEKLEGMVDSEQNIDKKKLLLDTIEDAKYWNRVHNEIVELLDTNFKKEHYNYISYEEIKEELNDGKNNVEK